LKDTVEGDDDDDEEEEEEEEEGEENIVKGQQQRSGGMHRNHVHLQSEASMGARAGSASTKECLPDNLQYTTPSPILPASEGRVRIVRQQWTNRATAQV